MIDATPVGVVAQRAVLLADLAAVDPDGDQDHHDQQRDRGDRAANADRLLEAGRTASPTRVAGVLSRTGGVRFQPGAAVAPSAAPPRGSRQHRRRTTAWPLPFRGLGGRSITACSEISEKREASCNPEKRPYGYAAVAFDEPADGTHGVGRLDARRTPGSGCPRTSRRPMETPRPCGVQDRRARRTRTPSDGGPARPQPLPAAAPTWNGRLRNRLAGSGRAPRPRRSRSSCSPGTGSSAGGSSARRARPPG